MTAQTNVAPERAAVALHALIVDGAEIEQRDIEGNPVATTETGAPNHIWALARGAFSMQAEPDTIEGDGPPEVWMCPLYPEAAELTPEGEMLFAESQMQMRPLAVIRFDLLPGGAVGMQHPAGGYSVVRPVSPTMVALLDAFDEWVERYGPDNG